MVWATLQKSAVSSQCKSIFVPISFFHGMMISAKKKQEVSDKQVRKKVLLQVCDFINYKLLLLAHLLCVRL